MNRRFIALRGLATLITGTLLILLSLILGLGFVLHSESGTRWLFDLARDLAPGELQVNTIKGRLTGPLDLEGVRYRDGDLVLELDRLHLDWQPSALLRQRLHLLTLEIKHGQLTLPPPETDATPSAPFPGLTLPLELILDSIEVTDFRITPPGAAEPIILDQLSLAARGVADEVNIQHLEAVSFGARVKLAGSLRLDPAGPMDLKLDWQYQLPDSPLLSGQGKIVGNLEQLKVEQTLAAPLSAVLSARLFELVQAPRWDAKLALDSTDLGAFNADFPARVSGWLHSTGTPEAVQLEANLELTEPSLGQLDWDLAITYQGGTVTAERLLVTTPAGSRIEGHGRYTTDDALGVLDAELSWNALRWPLSGETLQAHSERGQLKITGHPADYRYNLTMDAAVPDQPAVTLEATGSGNTEGMRFEALQVILPEGRIQGSGQANWAPQPAWELNLTGSNINPALFHADFPGKLTLDLVTRGRMQESVPQVEVNLASLNGEVRGYPLNATGKLKLDDEELQIEGLELTSGSSEARIEGTAGNTLDLNWSLKADDLTNLWPGLSGTLNSTGRLGGSPEAPQIHAAIDGKSIAFGGHEVAALQIRADLDLGGDQRMNLDLAAKELKTGAMQWQTLTLGVKGRRSAHHLDLKLDSRQAPAAQLAIDAGLDNNNTWSGHLRTLALTLPEIGRWDLEEPAAFTLSASTQKVQDLCLAAADGGRLCAELDRIADQSWKASLNAPAFPLAFFQHWLPPELKLTGRSDLTASFTADPMEAVSGQAELKLPEGLLTFELKGEPHRIDFSGGSLQAKLDASGAHTKLGIPLAGLGVIDGEINLPGLKVSDLNLEKQPLAGRLKASIDDLSLASVVAPQLQNVAGSIDMDFTLAGHLARPQVQGKALLKSGALDIQDLGLELRELSLSLTAPSLDRLKIQGTVSSGGGTLTLEGETRIDPEQGYPTRIKVQGKDWVAVNIPEAEVHISPELVILHSKERSELDGELHIPYGRIRPKELPKSAITGTSDLVVVGRDAPQQEEPADSNFHSRLRIIFGDRVSFQGFGLRANLTGNLLVIDEPGRPVIGRGRLGVTDGTYRAYGQDLKIERGYVLFADSPVDNPGVDVRAVREVDEVTAGLRVSGTLKAPKLALFSTPAMSQSEVASYLLTGRPPGKSGSNVDVATALQAAGIGNLTSETARQLGLEELRVETGSSLAEASVVAGTYLSPRLYVQYVNELASRETKLRLRYDLNDRLQIQTESGRSQGVDLFYTIER